MAWVLQNYSHTNTVPVSELLQHLQQEVQVGPLLLKHCFPSCVPSCEACLTPDLHGLGLSVEATCSPGSHCHANVSGCVCRSSSTVTSRPQQFNPQYPISQQ